ncbi:MAG: V-type ATP synthase subunit E family protein [Candidatus Eisenbacteria bacterium]
MEQGKAAKLRQKITGDAEAEANKIIEEGTAEAKAILDAAQDEADKIASDFKVKAEAEAKEFVRRQVSLRELEARKAVLTEKRKVIDRVFDEVLDKLIRRDRDGGYALTRDLMLKAIAVGDEEIIVSPEDKGSISGSFLNGLNKELTTTGRRGEVTLSEETRNFKGGFVLRRGRAESNSTFETLLSMLRDDVETEVAKILFGEGRGGA